MRRIVPACAAILTLVVTASGCGSSSSGTSQATCDAARRLAAADQAFSQAVHFTPDTDAATLLAVARRAPFEARPLLAAYRDLAAREPSIAADLRRLRAFDNASVHRTARARTIDELMAAIERTLTGSAHDRAEAAAVRVATWADGECGVQLDLP